jgi:SAM-dependent methyltransferase
VSADLDIDRSLIPPVEMMFDGPTNDEEFVRYGEGFARDVLIPRARLQPWDTFLDVGCGNGGVARALTAHLDGNGRYEGMDIAAGSITWLQDRYRRYPNFRFTHANVHNKWYNPGGASAPSDYRFPYPDNSVDVVLLKSVFTHMLPNDVRHYLAEVSRVMRPGGRALITFFLLNPESERFVSAGHDIMKMPYVWNDDAGCRVSDVENPEQVTAHDEQRIRYFYAEAGLTICDMAFGNWCGRPSLLGLQDMIVGIKL